MSERRGGHQPVPNLLQDKPTKHLNMGVVRTDQAAALFDRVWRDPRGAGEEVRRARKNGQQIHIGPLSEKTREALQNGKELVRLSSAPVPTKFGAWTQILYGDLRTGHIHTVMVYGNADGGSLGDKKNVLTRMHSSHHPNEIFNSHTSDDKAQLDAAMKEIQSKGRGVIIYLHDEGRGHGPRGQHDQFNNIYEWENNQTLRVKKDPKTGKPLTVDDGFRLAGRVIENRDNAHVREIITDLGLQSINLMTNNLNKVEQLKKEGIVINGTTGLIVEGLSDLVRATYQDAQKERADKYAFAA